MTPIYEGLNPCAHVLKEKKNACTHPWFVDKAGEYLHYLKKHKCQHNKSPNNYESEAFVPEKQIRDFCENCVL
jgi:hypothetical protein